MITLESVLAAIVFAVLGMYSIEATGTNVVLPISLGRVVFL